jgi:hypothetical protein
VKTSWQLRGRSSRSLTWTLTKVVLKGAFRCGLRRRGLVNKLAMLKSFCSSRNVCMF